MHYSLKLIMPTAQVESNRQSLEPVMKKLKCWDWYVIGGRWSGTLNRRFPWWNEWETQRAAIKEAHGVTDWYMPDYGDNIPVRRSQMPCLEALRPVWSKYSGLPQPVERDPYMREGYRDDIAPVDALMKAWLMGEYPSATHCYRDKFNDYYLYVSDKKHLAKLPVDCNYTVILVDYHD